jgi:rhodanese-related sulfurtransferase
MEGGIDLVPRDRPVLAYCGHGERASTALSLLEGAGTGPHLNLSGSADAWKAAGYAVV